MKLYSILLYLGLFSLTSVSNAEVSIPAFTLLDSSYSKAKNELEVKNMPRITSQDGFGICFAHIAATLMQAENCRALKVDCASLPESKLFSPVDISRFVWQENMKDGDAEYRSAFRGLNVKSGGNANNAVIIAGLGIGNAASEACVSLDRILSKMNSRGEGVSVQVALWKRIERLYSETRAAAAANQGCKDCVNNVYATAIDSLKPDLEKNLNIKIDNVQLLRAFSQQTYEKFLDNLLLPTRCFKPEEQVVFESMKNVTYEVFPQGTRAVTPKQFKEKAKEVLRTGRPIALGSICIGNENPDDCRPELLHGVVIAGFRTICNSAGKCRDSLKVVNSWGQSWQDQNNGGWVDADTLLSHVQISEEGNLGWFADKKGGAQ